MPEGAVSSEAAHRTNRTSLQIKNLYRQMAHQLQIFDLYDTVRVRA